MSRGRWNHWQAGLTFSHIRKRTKQLCSILENRPRFCLPEKDTKEVEPDNSMIELNKDPKPVHPHSGGRCGIDPRALDQTRQDHGWIHGLMRLRACGMLLIIRQSPRPWQDA